MKRVAKRIAAMAMAAVMVCGVASPVEAATHAKGCGAKTTVIRCGSFRTTTTDRHHLHTNVYCQRTAYIYSHYYACAGCGVRVNNYRDKICSRAHQYCPSEYSLCK